MLTLVLINQEKEPPKTVEMREARVLAALAADKSARFPFPCGWQHFFLFKCIALLVE